MFQLDHNGIPMSYIARHEVLSLGTRNDSVVLVTDGEVSEERRKMFEFICGQSVQLESLAEHPELQATFHKTIESCKEVMAAQPTKFIESAEELLERLEEDPDAECRCIE